MKILATGLMTAIAFWIATIPAGAEIIVINNGLAPPNPANVIDADNSFPDTVYVQNVGCDVTVAYPCEAPGSPTSVELVDGGSVGGGLSAFESSTVTISGGSVGFFGANDSSTVTMRGGSVAGAVTPSGHSSVVITGGSVGGIIAPDESSTVTIVGTGFAVDGVPVDFGPILAKSGTLTGTLESGEPIDTVFCHAYCGGPISATTGLITLVPEPEAAPLFSAAALSLAALRTAKRQSKR